jgi:hypothetical protein
MSLAACAMSKETKWILVFGLSEPRLGVLACGTASAGPFRGHPKACSRPNIQMVLRSARPAAKCGRSRFSGSCLVAVRAADPHAMRIRGTVRPSDFSVCSAEYGCFRASRVKKRRPGPELLWTLRKDFRLMSYSHVTCKYSLGLCVHTQ